MLNTQDIDTVVFDILGTLVDGSGGLRAALTGLVPTADGGQIHDLVALWHRHIGGEHRRIVGGARDYVRGAVLDREAAQVVADRAGITEPAAVDVLAGAARRPPAWPDSTAALARLAADHELIGLSNADHTTLLQLNAHAGLRWHTALSTQAARTYKPDPAVYRLAIDCAGRPPERMLMVAAHAWDLRGAQALGLRTAYLDRPGGDPPAADDRFDLHLTVLDDLADVLGGVRR